MSEPNMGMMVTEVGLGEDSSPSLNQSLKHELLKELEPDVLAKIKKGFDLYKGQLQCRSSLG